MIFSVGSLTIRPSSRAISRMPLRTPNARCTTEALLGLNLHFSDADFALFMASVSPWLICETHVWTSEWRMLLIGRSPHAG